MRVIIDNGKVSWDIPYETSTFEVRPGSEGIGLLHCDKTGYNGSVFTYESVAKGRMVLEEMAKAAHRNAAYYLIEKDTPLGIGMC